MIMHIFSAVDERGDESTQATFDNTPSVINNNIANSGELIVEMKPIRCDISTYTFDVLQKKPILSDGRRVSFAHDVGIGGGTDVDMDFSKTASSFIPDAMCNGRNFPKREEKKMFILKRKNINIYA